MLFRAVWKLLLMFCYPAQCSPKWRTVILAGAALTVVLALGLGAPQQGPGRANPAKAAAESGTSSKSAGAYADPAVCAKCHPAVAATFKKTGMGRSFRKMGSKEDLGAEAPPKPFYHAPSDTFLNMVFRDGAWFQRRWQIGLDGKETNVDEKRVDYVLGSGNHSRSFLHLTERNTLQELPLGWYSEKGGFWDMNPGYDRPDYAGSVRPVFYECMFCHNGYPRIPDEKQDTSQTRYLQPLPEGIDCQRCHGPGQDHVDKASRGATAQMVRAAIVNPARLNPEREMEVCLQCHLETSNEKLPHAVVRLDRAPFSYVPGQPLGDFEVAFDRAPGRNTGFEVAQAGYRFRESQCFLKSAGKLRCTTCHNPHDIPRGREATAQYNQVCTGCHQSVTSPAATKASEHQQGANCVGCHMPKRRTDDAVHIVMTDHFIAPRPPAGNLLAEKPERPETPATSYQGEVRLYYPPTLPSTADNDLTVAVAQVREQSNLTKGLPLLRAQIAKYHPTRPGYYAELGEAYVSVGDPASAIRSFEEALQLDPDSAPRLIQLGDALMQAREWAQAEAKLLRATELAPEDPRAWGRLGWALWQQDKAADARAAIEKAIGLGPEIADLRNNLALVLWGSGKQPEAEAQFREALRIQPGIAEWRLNLGRVLATEGKIPEALYQMEKSVRFKPDFVDARFDYARLLTDANQPREAETQAQAAVASDPKRADVHELLGALLAGRGDVEGAARELQTAVQLQPGFGQAHFELGMVLGQKGDAAGAREHLTIASQSRDPQVSAAAREQLQRIR